MRKRERGILLSGSDAPLRVRAPCASTQAATRYGLPYVALPRQAKFWASTSKAMRRSFGAGRAASIHATAATMSFAAGARTTTW